MKAAIRFTPLHKKYTYLYLENGTIAKAEIGILGIWKDGDIGELLQKNNKTMFKPYAEDVEVIDFKPFFTPNVPVIYDPSNQHAGSGPPPFVSEVQEGEPSDEASL